MNTQAHTEATLEQIDAALLYAFLALRIVGVVKTCEGYTAPAFHSSARTKEVIALAQKRLALKGVCAELQKLTPQQTSRSTYTISPQAREEMQQV
jgi:hypothetical protein